MRLFVILREGVATWVPLVLTPEELTLMDAAAAAQELR